MVVFDLTRNRKQTAYFNKVMQAVAGGSDLRYFNYGGGIRGGKTSVSLVILNFLARKYPNSRWHVIRDSFPNLQATTIPSFEKFFPEHSRYVFKYYRSSSNFHVRYNNGSRIYFVSENIKQDPDLNWLLGIETNGLLLEQVEGLSIKTWNRALERTGSWYIDPMPPGFIFSTFNPTQTWIKDKVYVPWKNGLLEAPYYYEQALPIDSPFITDDQWRAWQNLDALSRAQFIDGDWEAFASENRFAYAFDEAKHTVPEIPVNEAEPLYISFDFNHSPVTCLIAQHYDEKIYFLRELSSTKGLSDLVEMVKGYTQERVVFVTGDRSGWNRSELLEGNRTAYDMIQSGLDLTQYQIEAPLINPNLFKSRELLNSIFANYPEIRVSSYHCPLFVADLKFVEADKAHKIIKDRNKSEGKADFLDCGRYYLGTYFTDFVQL